MAAYDPATKTWTDGKKLEAIDFVLSVQDEIAAAQTNMPISHLAQGGATTGQAIVWNGNAWAPGTVSGGSGTTWTPGTGLSLTGSTISVTFGTTAGTAAQGNDSRIVSAEQTANKGQANGYAGLNGAAKLPLTSVDIGVATEGQALTLQNGVWAPITLAAGTTYSGIAPVSINGSAISVAVGTTSGTVAAGNDSRLTSALQPGAIPAATGQLLGGSGIAGTAAAITLGTGLSLSGTTLNAATNSGLTYQTTTYTASGAIDPNDDIAVLKSSSVLTMTLANGTLNGKAVEIKRFDGTGGAHAVALTLDGGSKTVTLNSPNGGDSLRVRWDTQETTYLQMAVDPGLKVGDLPTGTTLTGSELFAAYQGSADAKFSLSTIAAYNPNGYQTSAQVTTAISTANGSFVRDYVIGVTQPGVTGNAQKLLIHSLPHAITLPASLAGSSATALTAATASTAFVLAYRRSGTTTNIATFTFAAAGTTAAISGVTIPTLQAGDVLLITGPTTADTTLADIGFSILGTKS